MQPNETDQVRLRYVRVINNSSVPFTDRHDGVPVTIEPGKSENLPLDMAAHFFGPSFDPVSMLRHVSRRQGWNTPEFVQVNPATGKTKAEENFSKLKIEPVTYKLVEEKPDPREPIPAEQDLAADEDADAPRRGPGRPRKVNSEASA